MSKQLKIGECFAKTLKMEKPNKTENENESKKDELYKMYLSLTLKQFRNCTNIKEIIIEDIKHRFPKEIQEQYLSCLKQLVKQIYDSYQVNVKHLNKPLFKNLRIVKMKENFKTQRDMVGSSTYRPCSALPNNSDTTIKFEMKPSKSGSTNIQNNKRIKRSYVNLYDNNEFHTYCTGLYKEVSKCLINSINDKNKKHGSWDNVWSTDLNIQYHPLQKNKTEENNVEHHSLPSKRRMCPPFSINEIGKFKKYRSEKKIAIDALESKNSQVTVIPSSVPEKCDIDNRSGTKSNKKLNEKDPNIDSNKNNQQNIVISDIRCVKLNKQHFNEQIDADLLENLIHKLEPELNQIQIKRIILKYLKSAYENLENGKCNLMLSGMKLKKYNKTNCYENEHFNRFEDDNNFISFNAPEFTPSSSSLKGKNKEEQNLSLTSRMIKKSTNDPKKLKEYGFADTIFIRPKELTFDEFIKYTNIEEYILNELSKNCTNCSSKFYEHHKSNLLQYEKYFYKKWFVTNTEWPPGILLEKGALKVLRSRKNKNNLHTENRNELNETIISESQVPDFIRPPMSMTQSQHSIAQHSTSLLSSNNEPSLKTVDSSDKEKTSIKDIPPKYVTFDELKKFTNMKRLFDCPTYDENVKKKRMKNFYKNRFLKSDQWPKFLKINYNAKLEDFSYCKMLQKINENGVVTDTSSVNDFNKNIDENDFELQQGREENQKVIQSEQENNTNNNKETNIDDNNVSRQKNQKTQLIEVNLSGNNSKNNKNKSDVNESVSIFTADLKTNNETSSSIIQTNKELNTLCKPLKRKLYTENFDDIEYHSSDDWSSDKVNKKLKYTENENKTSLKSNFSPLKIEKVETLNDFECVFISSSGDKNSQTYSSDQEHIACTRDKETEINHDENDVNSIKVETEPLINMSLSKCTRNPLDNSNLSIVNVHTPEINNNDNDNIMDVTNDTCTSENHTKQCDKNAKIKIEEIENCSYCSEEVQFVSLPKDDVIEIDDQTPSTSQLIDEMMNWQKTNSQLSKADDSVIDATEKNLSNPNCEQESTHVIENDRNLNNIRDMLPIELPNLTKEICDYSYVDQITSNSTTLSMLDKTLKDFNKPKNIEKLISNEKQGGSDTKNAIAINKNPKIRGQVQKPKIVQKKKLNKKCYKSDSINEQRKKNVDSLSRDFCNLALQAKHIFRSLEFVRNEVNENKINTHSSMNDIHSEHLESLIEDTSSLNQTLQPTLLSYAELLSKDNTYFIGSQLQMKGDSTSDKNVNDNLMVMDELFKTPESQIQSSPIKTTNSTTDKILLNKNNNIENDVKMMQAETDFSNEQTTKEVTSRNLDTDHNAIEKEDIQQLIVSLDSTSNTIDSTKNLTASTSQEKENENNLLKNDALSNEFEKPNLIFTATSSTIPTTSAASITRSVLNIPKRIQQSQFNSICYLNLQKVEFIIKNCNSEFHKNAKITFDSQIPFLQPYLCCKRFMEATIRFPINGFNRLHIFGNSLQFLFSLADENWSYFLNILKIIEQFKYDSKNLEFRNESLSHRVLYYFFKTLPKFSEILLEFENADINHVRLHTIRTIFQRPNDFCITNAINPIVLDAIKQTNIVLKNAKNKI